MEITFIIWLLVAGVGVGFINGLFGVGGCFLMVPTMFFLFKGLGVPVDTAMKVSLCTNMAVVVPTALSGAWRHAKKIQFPWSHYWNFAIAVGVGSLVGSGIAVFVPGAILKVLFGVLCLIGAWRFMTAKPRPVDEMPPVEKVKFWPTGIGGGLVYVPTLNTFLSVPIHTAVATSQATMVIGFSVGALTFIILGLFRHLTDLPPLSLSYFNLVAWLALVVTSIPLAQVGAVTAHKLTPKRLKFLLALLYIYVGLKLIGVFVPVASLPLGLQIVARALPLTYAVEALRAALAGGALADAALDLLVLAAFAVILFALAVCVLARRLD